MFSLTALILTFNEQANIGRTLAALAWTKEILIVDSGSTDRTVEVAKSMDPNVRIVTRRFDSHPNQWNFGLDQVSTEWVLTLDADYQVSPQLAEEIKLLAPEPNRIGYWAEFEYRIYGHPLRGSSYPPRIMLFKPKCARYVDDGHTQTLWIKDAADALVPPPGDRDSSESALLGRLVGKVYHDDRKSLNRWIQEQDRYSKLEARHLASRRFRDLNFHDKIRRAIVFAPPAIFIYLMFVRGLILDGWPGWFYVAQRTTAEVLLSVRLLIERPLRKVDGTR